MSGAPPLPTRTGGKTGAGLAAALRKAQCAQCPKPTGDDGSWRGGPLFTVGTRLPPGRRTAIQGTGPVGIRRSPCTRSRLRAAPRQLANASEEGRHAVLVVVLTDGRECERSAHGCYPFTDEQGFPKCKFFLAASRNRSSDNNQNRRSNGKQEALFSMNFSLLNVWQRGDSSSYARPRTGFRSGTSPARGIGSPSRNQMWASC